MIRECSLCSQLAGEEPGDLIAKVVGGPYIKRVLFDSLVFGTIPSLGPLAEGHLLLCPKTHVRSFAELPSVEYQAGQKNRDAVRELLLRVYGLPVHEFEHGNSARGSEVACSTEHAHLHFVPSLAEVKLPHLGNELSWIEYDGSLAELGTLVDGREYLQYRSPEGRSWVVIGHKGLIPSQALRRSMAEAMGCPDNWNWKTALNAHLVVSTYEKLRGVAGL